MSAPLIWIIIPVGFSLLLLGLSRFRKVVLPVSIVFCISMALSAWKCPIDQTIRISSLIFKVDSSMSVIGRTLTLDSGLLTLVIFLYLIISVWLAGFSLTSLPTWMAPLSIMMAALLIAATAIEPFLYAALIIEWVVLISVPMLAPPSTGMHQGVLRYLTFMTLAMPFILYTGWILAGVETTPSDSELVTRSLIMLGLGFSFLLALFPFNTWVPMLMEKSSPMVVGLLLILLTAVVIVFALNFIDRYLFMREDDRLFMAVRFAGLLMVTIAGVWAAFERHLGRLLGYAILMQSGLALLSISLNTQDGWTLLFSQFIPRALGIGSAALALELLRQRTGGLNYADVRGKLRQLPFISACLLFSLFSLGGLPLLAGYPLRQALMEGLSAVSGLDNIWVLAGSLGFLFACLRVMANLAETSGEEGWKAQEKPLEALFISGLILVIWLVGLYPQVFMPLMTGLAKAFEHLG
ncbi:MAG TPA: proton-conducting transporter membrane subunit [Anaerolineaceae bacterium]|nr:proton-conducting transporter membrane subunit [Anaerolineaceae bacterium]HPN52902.1 proton-conducting transporter membrane subunit [Anaerolineaceae bacterium]